MWTFLCRRALCYLWWPNCVRIPENRGALKAEALHFDHNPFIAIKKFHGLNSSGPDWALGASQENNDFGRKPSTHAEVKATALLIFRLSSKRVPAAASVEFHPSSTAEWAAARLHRRQIRTGSDGDCWRPRVQALASRRMAVLHDAEIVKCEDRRRIGLVFRRFALDNGNLKTDRNWYFKLPTAGTQRSTA